MKKPAQRRALSKKDPLAGPFDDARDEAAGNKKPRSVARLSGIVGRNFPDTISLQRFSGP